MKTLAPLTLLIFLFSSYKSYTILEYQKQNKESATEICDRNTIIDYTKTQKELLFDQDLQYKTIVHTLKLSENFTVEIDGTAVIIKSLHKRLGIQLLSKKESHLFYKENSKNPLLFNNKKAIAQLD